MAAKERKPKEITLIRAAIDLLRDEGDRGLTMRSLAAAAGMSLSNAQYYFPTKDVLYAALVEDYADQCTEFITGVLAGAPEGGGGDALEATLAATLEAGPELEEMCAVFRELWAVATREPAVAEELDRYYRRLAGILANALFAHVEHAPTREDLVLLLIPYIEGHSIAGRAVGGDPVRTAALLRRLVDALSSES